MEMIDREHFYISLTQKDIPFFYSSLKNNISDTILFTCNRNLQIVPKLKTTSISLFPCYLTPTFFQNKNLFIKRIPQIKITGYAIILDGKSEIEMFLKNKYKKSFKDNITRLVKRLEYCFDITYEMFFGSITKETCEKLMYELKVMLTNRFNQRGDTTNVYGRWDEYIELTYNQINNKRASIFVIYANNTPISISVNHHLNDILFVSIPSYDIDYGKFALGNISIYKLLEWALNNNYSMLDMAYGDLEYKRRWSTSLYEFEHHVIYPNNNIKQVIAANYEINSIKLKNFIKKHDLNTAIKKLLFFNRKKATHYEVPNYKIEPTINIDLVNFKQINAVNNDYPFLKKLVYDFLYINKENINDISVYKHNDKKEFLIDGKSSSQKIIF